MANKRALKKAIHSICEELFAEAVAISLYGPESSRESAKALLFSIVKMHAHYITRVSHPEPGMSAKEYYNNLSDQFGSQVSEMMDQINA